MNIVILKRSVSISILFTPFYFYWCQHWRPVHINQQMKMKGLLLCAAHLFRALSSSMPKITQRFLIIYELTSVLGSSSVSVTGENWKQSDSSKAVVPSHIPDVVPSYQRHQGEYFKMSLCLVPWRTFHRRGRHLCRMVMPFQWEWPPLSALLYPPLAREAGLMDQLRESLPLWLPVGFDQWGALAVTRSEGRGIKLGLYS